MASNPISTLVNKNISDAHSVVTKYWSTTCPYYTGLNIKATNVYNIYKGVVLFVGLVDGRYTVTVQLTTNACIRYGNLSSVSVKAGQLILDNVLIGVADKFLRFEYCIKESEIKTWPVRIDTETYYKNDPYPIISGQVLINLTDYADFQIITDPTYEPMTFDRFQLEEFSDNRGDNIVEF